MQKYYFYGYCAIFTRILSYVHLTYVNLQHRVLQNDGAAFILKCRGGSVVFDGFTWLDPATGRSDTALHVAALRGTGAGWLWLTDCECPRDAPHIRRVRGSCQSGHCYLLQTELSPRTPMGVAPVTVSCVWTERGRSDQCSYFQSQSLRAVSDRLETCRPVGWFGSRNRAERCCRRGAGAGAAAAAEAAAEAARMWCRTWPEKQRFKSRKGNLFNNFCCISAC